MPAQKIVAPAQTRPAARLIAGLLLGFVTIGLATVGQPTAGRAADLKSPLARLDLKDGDGIVFYGDSITHQRLYTQYHRRLFLHPISAHASPAAQRRGQRVGRLGGC